MRVFYLIGAVTLFASPSVAKPFDPVALEKATWAAFRDKNAAAFSALIAPDYVGIYADGRHDKAIDMQLIRKTTLRSFSLSDFKTQRLDPRDVLVTYAADVTSATGRNHVWNASIWRLERGRWMTVYHTEVVAK